MEARARTYGYRVGVNAAGLQVQRIVADHGLKFLSRAHTLGARGMSFYGMDSTYASTIAILRRIFDLEAKRTGKA